MINNFITNKLPIVLIGLLPSIPALVYADTCSTLLAAGKLENAVEAGRKQGDVNGIICAGRSLSAMSRHADALAIFKQAEAQVNSPYERCLLSLAIARTTRDSGQTDQAITLYQQSFEQASQLKQKQAQRTSLNEWGQILLTKADTKTALERFIKGYTYASNDNERAQSNELVASAYRQLGDYDHATEYQLKGALLEGRSGDLEDYLYAMLELADIRTLNKDFQAAQKDIEEVLSKSKAAESDYWIARSQLYLGRLEIARGNQGAAVDVLQSALTLAKKVGDTDLIALIIKELKWRRATYLIQP